MKSKEEIVKNWLPRYTGEKLENFGEYILLTNFDNYVQLFAEWHKVKMVGENKPMQCATAGEITIINFGMGSPSAATVMDLLTAVKPKAVLFLGKCGGLKKRNKLSELFLPIAAIVVKVHPTIIFRQKFRRSRRLLCKKRFQQPSEITKLIIGRELYTPLTAACGSMTKFLKTISKK